jgi:hypothetical protein
MDGPLARPQKSGAQVRVPPICSTRVALANGRIGAVRAIPNAKLSDREESKRVGRDDRSQLGTIRQRAAVKTYDVFY